MLLRLTLPLAIVASVTVGAPTARAERPNVLFIAVDDLVPALGCYGDSVAQTPQIDSLASQGTTFLRHHTQWAVCGPSRAALTTSLMPEETNVMGFKKIRDKNFLPNVITLPQHFKNNGYETACTGKFHDQRTVGTPVPTSVTYPDGVMDNGGTVDDPESWSVPYLDAPSGFSTPTKVAVDATDQTDSLYEDHKILTAGLSLIDDLIGAGGAAPGNKPFFLAIGFKKPHLPFVAPKRYWDLYNRADMPLAAFTGLPSGSTTYNSNTLLNNSELVGGGDDATNGYEPYKSDNTLLQVAANQRELIHGYYACVSFLDNLVGEIRTKLATTDDPLQPGKKLSETTIVVLWGDHGFHLGDHGRWAKHTAMDRATSSPLIIFDPRNPKRASNNKTTSPAGTIDIYPTLCELATLPMPEQPATTGTTTGRPIRGRSLVPIMNSPASSVNGGVISQFSINGQYGYAYRTERFRYIEWVSSSGNMNDGNARRDLFDYDVDPLESVNHATDPAYAAVVYQLSRSMRDETTVCGADRLMLAPAVAEGAGAFLPDVRISPAAEGVSLKWPASGGVSYRIVGSPDLVTWMDDFSNLAGSEKAFPISGSRRFFKVGFGSNRPPIFLSDPLVKASAQAGVAYSASLVGDVFDPDEALAYEKLSGPSWLTVSASGMLGGTPPPGVENADYFRIQATDASGHPTRATLQISVTGNTSPSQITEVVRTQHSGSYTYGTTLAAGVQVLAGDLVVVAHANNKNTSTNTISLSGLGPNTVQLVNSGSSGTSSGAWVLTSAIAQPGSYDLVLDTSNANKNVTHATTVLVLRPVNGTLSIVASDGSVSAATSLLSLDFTMSPAIQTGRAVVVASTNGTTFSATPPGWTQEANASDRRRTCTLDTVVGESLSASFTNTISSDMALAGVVIKVSP